MNDFYMHVFTISDMHVLYDATYTFECLIYDANIIKLFYISISYAE